MRHASHADEMHATSLAGWYYFQKRGCRQQCLAYMELFLVTHAQSLSRHEVLLYHVQACTCADGILFSLMKSLRPSKSYLSASTFCQGLLRTTLSAEASERNGCQGRSLLARIDTQRHRCPKASSKRASEPCRVTHRALDSQYAIDAERCCARLENTSMHTKYDQQASGQACQAHEKQSGIEVHHSMQQGWEFCMSRSRCHVGIVVLSCLCSSATKQSNSLLQRPVQSLHTPLSRKSAS